MNVWNWCVGVLAEYRCDNRILDVSTLLFARWRGRWRWGHRSPEMRKSTKSLRFLLILQGFSQESQQLSIIGKKIPMFHFLIESSVVSSWPVPHFPSSLDADHLSGEGDHANQAALCAMVVLDMQHITHWWVDVCIVHDMIKWDTSNNYEEPSFKLKLWKIRWVHQWPNAWEALTPPAFQLVLAPFRCVGFFWPR